MQTPQEPADRATVDAILDAAETLFAEQGFAATTVKQLAAGAGVTPALLYYYFRDKERLYDAVIRRLVADFVASGLRRLDEITDPADAIRRLIGGQVELVLHRPAFPRIMTREMVDRGRRVEAPLTELAAGLFARLCGVIEQGQREGRFRRDLDPRFAAVSTVAQVAYMFVARPAIGILFGHGLGGPPESVVRDYGRHAAEFALAALAVRPSTAITPETAS